MSDELLAGYGANWALEDVRRRGIRGVRGTDDIIRALRERHRRAAEELNTSGSLARWVNSLRTSSAWNAAHWMTRGKKGLEKHLELDALPTPPVQKLEAMKNYTFISDGAPALRALLEGLKTEVRTPTSTSSRARCAI